MLTKILKRFFEGKKSNIEQKIQDTPEYLDGLLVEHKNKLDAINRDYQTAVGELKNHIEKIETARKTLKKFEDSSRRLYEKYEQTQDKNDLTKAKESFLFAKENKEVLIELEKQESAFQINAEKLQKAKEIFQNKLTNARIEITKRKSRIEFTKKINTLSTAVRELDIDINDDLTNGDKINVDFHVANAKLDELDKEMSILDTDSASLDDEFASFIKEKK